MNTDQYQQEVSRTTPSENRTEALTIGALGLAGEAGEVIDLLKKHLYHGHPLDLPTLATELGDVLWYMAYICNTMYISLDMVMAMNVDKLRERYPNGWEPERSIHRTL